MIQSIKKKNYGPVAMFRVLWKIQDRIPDFKVFLILDE